MLDLRKIVNNQLELGERLLWTGQPDAATVTTKLLVGFILVLGAIFAESVSLVGSAGADVEELLFCRVAGLVFFACVGAAVLWAVPKRAARVIYAVTDRRVLKLDLNMKVHHRALENVKHLNHAIVYERTNLPEGFWFSLAANSFIFCAWFALFIPVAIESCDGFIALATVLLVAAIGGFIYDRHYLPDSRWREAGGVLYWIDKTCVYLQDVRLKDICDVKIRTSKSGINDLFVVTKKNGCLRLPSISCPEGAKHVLTKFGSANATTNAS